MMLKLLLIGQSTLRWLPTVITVCTPEDGWRTKNAAVHAQQLHYLSKGWWSKSISWVPTRSHCSPFVWKLKWCWHWHSQRGDHCEAYWASLCLSNSWNRIETKAPEEMQSVLQERSSQGQSLPLCLLSKQSWPMLLSLLWTVPHKMYTFLGLNLIATELFTFNRWLF